MSNTQTIAYPATEITAIVPYQYPSKSEETAKKERKTAYRQQKMDTWRFLMAAGVIASVFLHFMRIGSGVNLISHLNNFLISPAAASTQPVTSKLVEGAKTPDWSQKNFRDMKFSEPGSVDFPNMKNPGMKERRSWSTGQSLAEVMELGDFEATDFKIEDFTLSEIADITGIDLDSINLSQFETLDWQTLEELAEAIPQLKDLEAGEIPPIQELVRKATGNNAQNQTVGELLKNYPELKDAELGEFVDLNKHKLDSIPGLKDAQIKEFTNWQNTTIAKVPGLADVPFDKFKGVPIPDLSFVGTVDLPLGSKEGGRWKSISGSFEEGFNVPCEKNCGHIEVSGSDILTGAQWMSGKDQKVRGGFGILGNLNGGEEPTGRHPFGSAFKQVIWDVNEGDGSITTKMFFRICKRGFVDMGCSPYFIGPVPFFTYREKDPIILGTPLTVPTKKTP
ncbi:MAG: hypothetical protein KME64_37670 [Scytonematopsis contorta HA4267-MV1]|nr:hypothetical protein [Scytonematopsis contorta HA4267-MV1]